MSRVYDNKMIEQNVCVGRECDKIHMPALVQMITEPSTIQISLHTDMDKTPWLKRK